MWSKAVVTPIFKGGDSCNASNYRPISLTCVACKLMERIIAVQMLDYLRVNSLISPYVISNGLTLVKNRGFSDDLAMFIWHPV